jgi:hypothetical protein
MAEIQRKKPRSQGLQGLLVSVCYRSRPLTPGVPNNHHDLDDAKRIAAEALVVRTRKKCPILLRMK